MEEEPCLRLLRAEAASTAGDDTLRGALAHNKSQRG